MVKYGKHNIYNFVDEIKKNKQYAMIIFILFFLFGKQIMKTRLNLILTFPLLRYFILFFIVNSRIKDRWTSLYVVIFVFVCFQIVSYIDLVDDEFEDDSDEEDN